MSFLWWPSRMATGRANILDVYGAEKQTGEYSSRSEPRFARPEGKIMLGLGTEGLGHSAQLSMVL